MACLKDRRKRPRGQCHLHRGRRRARPVHAGLHPRDGLRPSGRGSIHLHLCVPRRPRGRLHNLFDGTGPGRTAAPAEHPGRPPRPDPHRRRYHRGRTGPRGHLRLGQIPDVTVAEVGIAVAASVRTTRSSSAPFPSQRLSRSWATRSGGQAVAAIRRRCRNSSLNGPALRMRRARQAAVRPGGHFRRAAR